MLHQIIIEHFAKNGIEATSYLGLILFNERYILVDRNTATVFDNSGDQEETKITECNLADPELLDKLLKAIRPCTLSKQ